MNDEAKLPEHVRRNRVHWDARAEKYVGPGERAWARKEPTWGIWHVPDAEFHLLPEDLAGKDVIELGCGTAYISAWFARRGARVVGIDNSAAQLATAHRLQREHGLTFVLIHGNDIIDYFTSYEDAIKNGYQKYGVSTPFLVKQIHAVEQAHFISRLAKHATA